MSFLDFLAGETGADAFVAAVVACRGVTGKKWELILWLAEMSTQRGGRVTVDECTFTEVISERQMVRNLLLSAPFTNLVMSMSLYKRMGLCLTLNRPTPGSLA